MGKDKQMKSLIAAMTVGLVAVALGGSSARAQDVGPFQIEAEFSVDIDTPDADTDITTIGLGGMYAFKSVDPGTNPLDEALFLARVPYAGAMVGFMTGTTDVGTSVDLSGTALMVGGGYADENVPVGVDVMYMSSPMDISATGVSGTVEMSQLQVQAGYFAMPNLLVGLSYGSGSQKLEIDGVGTVMEADMSSIGVVGKMVQEIGDGMALNAEIGYSAVTATSPGVPDAKASVIEIGADYYLNQLIGIGLGLEFEAGDEADDDSTAIEIRFKWNLGTLFGAGITYSVVQYEASGVDDATTLGISLVGRF